MLVHARQAIWLFELTGPVLTMVRTNACNRHGADLRTERGVSSMAELQSSKLRTMGSIPSRRSNQFQPVLRFRPWRDFMWGEMKSIKDNQNGPRR